MEADSQLNFFCTTLPSHLFHMQRFSGINVTVKMAPVCVRARPTLHMGYTIHIRVYQSRIRVVRGFIRGYQMSSLTF